MGNDTPDPDALDAPPRFGELALQLGLLDQQQVEQGLELQSRQRRVLKAAGSAAGSLKTDRVGEILQRLGYLDEQGVRRILDAQTQARTSGDKAARRRIGDFELIQKLGQGAMGAVYLVRQHPLNRLLALKILPPDLAHDQEFLERFRREARAAARLRHPHIVTAYDVGVAGGYHYIAMEYVDGMDLDRGLREQPGGRYPPPEVLLIAKEICRALACANAGGIVHRDIKPANILRHRDGTYKLTDLGLATPKSTDKRVTSTGIAVGTPHYISPEQARGEMKVDVRADIYSLGATLYHLATGRLPFPGETAVEVMTAHLTDQLRPPMEVEPSVPKGLSRLIEKMMAKEIEDRPQTPEEVMEDIARVERGQIPLLKRARSRAGPFSWGGSSRPPQPPLPDATKEADERPGSLKPRISHPPRGSRFPGGQRRGRTGPLGSPGKLSFSMRRAVFWVVFLSTAVLVGVVLSRMW